MFSLQLKGGVPISEQLGQRITELIVSGVLEENEKLPTVREVAKQLAINPNTVQKTYRELEQYGLIYSLPGKGSYVREKKDYIDDIKTQAKKEFLTSVNDAMMHGLTKDELKQLIDSKDK